MTLQLKLNGTDFTAKWRPYESRWTARAWNGESATSEFVIDDFDGAIDHDDLNARKIVEVWEDASGTPVCLYHGRISNKTLGMGPSQVQPAMRWTIQAEDFNSELTGIRVNEAARPEETDEARFEAIRVAMLVGAASTHPQARQSTDLGNTYLGGGTAIDIPAEHYTDTFPGDIFSQIVELTGRIFFVYTADDGTGELYYGDRSDMALLADIEIDDDAPASADGIDKFAPYKGQAGDHGGQGVLTGGAVRYEDGSLFEDSNIGGSEAVYDRWETTITNDFIHNENTASNLLNKAITNHDEDQTYFAIIDMRPEDVHRLKAGMMVPLTRKRANKLADDPARAVVVTYEPVKPNAAGESWYRVTAELGRPQSGGTLPKSRRRMPRPPSGITGTNTLLGVACSSEASNFPSAYPPWSGDNEERVHVDIAVGVQAGETLIAVVTNTRIHAFDVQVYDEQGNTWTLDAEHENTGSSLDDYVGIWRCNVTNAMTQGDYVRFAANLGASISPTSEFRGRCLGVYKFAGALSGPTAGTGAGTFGGAANLTTPAGDVVIAGLTTGAAGDPPPDPDWDAMVPYDNVGDRTILAQQLSESTGSTFTSDWTGGSRDWSAISVGYTLTTSGGGGGGGGPIGTIGGTGSSSSGPVGYYIPVGSVLEHTYIDEGGPYHDADQVVYDPTASGLAATNVQTAIDELAEGTISDVVDHGTMGASEDFDASVGADQEGILDDDLTVTLSGAVDGEAAWLTLILTQDGSGGNDITWPGSVVWPGGIAPTIDQNADAVTIVSLVSYDGGTNWYGAFPGAGASSEGGGLPLTAEIDGEGFIVFDENFNAIGTA